VSQSSIIAESKSDTIEQSKKSKVKIYILSDPGCGFCRRAIKDIGNWAIGKEVNIVALDVSGNPSASAQNSLYQKYSIEVIDASNYNDKLKKFIPKIFIFETATNKKIMKLRGWSSRDLSKLEKKLKKYIDT
jgi:Ni2+-binding GTPase involved in maturation of urease and hydrogenase